MGLITEQCPHRRASLAYGIPTNDGIRCPYHGWEFGHAANASANSRTSRRKARSSTRSRRRLIRSRRWAGMFWAYMGPAESKPLLPRIDGFVTDGTIRMLRPRDHSGELAADHGELARPDPHRMAARPHLRVRQGAEGPEPQGRDQHAAREDRVPRIRARHHQAPAARRTLGGGDDWKVGHPVVFPNILSVGNGDESSTRATTRSRSACRPTTPTPCTSGTRPMCRRRA
jgi:5,5'-dehydrodivanillate O-demethylase